MVLPVNEIGVYWASVIKISWPCCWSLSWVSH